MMSSRYPFTAAQWQELEQQALFFKFTMSGLPIPPHLLFSINHMTQPQHTKWRLTQNQPGAEEQMGRNGGVLDKFLEIQSTVKDICIEANAVQETQTLFNPHLLHQLLKLLLPHSNLSSITSDLTHNHLKAVKDSNFMTFLGIGSGYKFTNQQKLFSDLSSDVKYEAGVVDVGRVEKRQRTMFQFIEESPQEKNDSWLNLVI
ncbi:hypothetical protein QQ045_029213 [Rhodiola kirilowii]